MNTEPWVTAAPIAQHQCVAKDTVYSWRESKGLPAHLVGQPWIFQLFEVDFDDNQVGSAHAKPPEATSIRQSTWAAFESALFTPAGPGTA